MGKHLFVYEDTIKKIEESLSGHHIKQSKYWRGYIFALSEYGQISGSEYETLRLLIDVKYETTERELLQ